MKFIKLISFLLFFISQLFFAQELPPIVKFSSNTYGAASQNWMISQDQKQFVYFANNEGLLEFNGSEWKLNASPNETIMRSVKVVGDKIFTGCYMEFGFWKRQTNGQLKYNSLSNRVKSKLIEDEHFWNIVNIDNWVLFQSFNRIYAYDVKKNTISFIENHPYIFKIYRVNNSIYFQKSVWN